MKGTVDDLRFKILDRTQIVIAERVGTGDGSKNVFKFLHRLITPESVYVDVAELKKAETTDYSVDYVSGKLTFVIAPPDEAPIRVNYTFATFSDEELQVFLDQAEGNLAGAAGSALETLIADQGKLITWSRGDLKTDFDRLRSDIKDVANRYHAQAASESTGTKTKDVNWEDVE